MARSIAQFLAEVLIERVPSMAARAPAPTWSTPGRPCRNVRRVASERTTSASAVIVIAGSLRASRPVDLAKNSARDLARLHRHVASGKPGGRRTPASVPGVRVIHFTDTYL